MDYSGCYNLTEKLNLLRLASNSIFKGEIMSIQKKIGRIPPIPEQTVELTLMYGPSLWLQAEGKIEAYMYKQYSTIEGFAQSGLVKKFLKEEDAKRHMIFKINEKIQNTKEYITKLEKLLKKVEDNKYEIKELEDDIYGRG